MKAVIQDHANAGSDVSCAVAFVNGGVMVSQQFFNISILSAPDVDTFMALLVAAILSYSSGQGYGLTAADIIPSSPTTQPVQADFTETNSSALDFVKNKPVSPSSYQTIVSQTGTAAPAVAGGFAPVNTYSGAPTFTWARSSAGVYTLTASSAIFSTSGKTGVFIAPLQNLNGSIRAIVTSSTVITVTTAVQSLAVLGLLGFAATNTDALLSGTMVYVQTYP